MMKSEKVKELLRRLQEGTASIYSRYESLIKASDAEYDAKIQALEGEYQRAAGQASAQSKIDLKNTLEKMADAGYLKSGGTVQATLSANANRSAALSALSVQKAKDKKAYELEKEKAKKDLSLQGEEEALAYENQISDAILQQENLEREYEEKEKERLFEQKIKEENLKLEKQLTQAKLNQMSQETKKAEEGIVPNKDPYKYVDEIIKQNTTVNKKKGYKVIDRKGILLAISFIVKDTKLSYQYRYEMYLYGKSLGYIK